MRGRILDSKSRPYIISWNLTYRCNLACEHCYLDAGPSKLSSSPDFSDRSELNTEECYSVIDQIEEFAPECVTILTGGEPLLRRDIVEIIRYGAAKDLWIVVGTNGVKITNLLAGRLKSEGVRGMALSLDALDADRHDSFRLVKGAWDNTVNGAKILASSDLPFIVQTTVGKHNSEELEELARFAFSELGAKVWNLYFLVQTGRGQFVSDISDAQYEQVLATLSKVQKEYAGRMLVNAKCAPHFAKTLFEDNPKSPFLKTYTEGAGGCPAGSHYMGIRPNGDMTPCPYLPVFAGNLRRETFTKIWQESEVFSRIRGRKEGLGGRCGACEFQGICGGCRARAYGVHGDYMAEDPLCNYEPGKYPREQVENSVEVHYGSAANTEIEWELAAKERMKKVPAFVRGMVVKSVESHCLEKGISLVTVTELDQIRSRMPSRGKIFRA